MAGPRYDAEMRPLPSVSRVLAAAIAAALLLSGCGGDEAFPKDEFVKQTTASGITKPVAECAYDQIKDNAAINQELDRAGGPNPNISEKVSGELSTILARCLLAADEAANPTTTTKPTSKSTTTEKTSSSDRSTTTKKK